jgi:hypothetical protein
MFNGCTRAHLRRNGNDIKGAIMSRKASNKNTGRSRRRLVNEPTLPSSPKRNLVAVAVASCLMLGSPMVFAQSSGSNLRGQVSAESGPAANAEVVATNLATGAVRRTRTSADGSYVLLGLPPGTYSVEAGGNAGTVTLSVASNATLNLEPAGEVVETVTVTGTRVAAADVRTSEVGNTISLHQIEQLPQSTRNFLEFADTVPGMAFTTNAQGYTSLRSGALSSNASNLYIDGVGQKSYVEAGGIAGQNETRKRVAILFRNSRSISTKSSLPTTKPSTAKWPARLLPR